jgi:unsaturated chondroitin disaccharide hydrolase
MAKATWYCIIQRIGAADFFPGNLWFLYEYSGDKFWKEQSEPFTAVMEAEKTNRGTHDMGFKLYNSVGNAYRLTHEQRYKDDIIEAAKTLIPVLTPL